MRSAAYSTSKSGMPSPCVFRARRRSAWGGVAAHSGQDTRTPVAGAVICPTAPRREGLAVNEDQQDRVETLAEVGARLARETAEAYGASPFAALSRDYFSRFSRDPP